MKKSLLVCRWNLSSYEQFGNLLELLCGWEGDKVSSTNNFCCSHLYVPCSGKFQSSHYYDDHKNVCFHDRSSDIKDTEPHTIIYCFENTQWKVSYILNLVDVRPGKVKAGISLISDLPIFPQQISSLLQYVRGIGAFKGTNRSVSQIGHEAAFYFEEEMRNARALDGGAWNRPDRYGLQTGERAIIYENYYDHIIVSFYVEVEIMDFSEEVIATPQDIALVSQMTWRQPKSSHLQPRLTEQADEHVRKSSAHYIAMDIVNIPMNGVLSRSLVISFLGFSSLIVAFMPSKDDLTVTLSNFPTEGTLGSRKYLVGSVVYEVDIFPINRFNLQCSCLNNKTPFYLAHSKLQVYAILQFRQMEKYEEMMGNYIENSQLALNLRMQRCDLVSYKTWLVALALESFPELEGSQSFTALNCEKSRNKCGVESRNNKLG
ncbi:hypothetical protein C0J52_08764 [Blattella germanica]|nr:hypothetical protein C0J52_08764 [Blattella germanica]